MNLEKSILSGEQMAFPDVLLPDAVPGWNAAQGIAALLLDGEENALPLSYLMRITGRDAREIRQLIQRERLAGVPILANMRSGYYLPATDAERVRWVRSMLHRAAEIAASAHAIQRGGAGDG